MASTYIELNNVSAGGSGATEFTGLTDTPSAYTSNALQFVRVNAGETALEFTAAGTGDVTGPGSSTDDAIARFDSTTGKIIQNSGVTIDDSNNVTIPGDLTVNGTTTTINTSTLDVTDANVTINNGGNQATANSNVAGITVEMSDATDVRLGYDSSTTSRMKVGDSGSEAEIATVSHAQILTNKTISGASNTISNLNASNLSTGTIPDARIQTSGVTQHEAFIDHDALTNFVANEHIDWTSATSAFSTTVTGATTAVDITQSGSGTSLNINNSGSGSLLVVDTSALVVPSSGSITTNRDFTAANIITAGNVDGRDVSADGTKLDTIETNADATDATNVQAAGALMDSELTNETAIKALDQGVATTDSPSFAGLTVDTNTLHVDSANNRVGVRTTSPGAPLDLSVSGSSTDIFRFGDTSRWQFKSESDTRYLTFERRDLGSGASQALTFDGDTGFLGVGSTTPSGARLVSEDVTNPQLRLIHTSIASYLFDVNSSGDLDINKDGTTRLHIDTAGNVGIGTDAPPLKLTVDGGTRFRNSSATRYRSDINVQAAQTTINSFDDTGVTYQPLRTDSSTFEVRTGTETSAVFIDSSQNVGIKTTSPDTLLNLGFSGADDKNTLRIEGSNGTSQRYAFDIEADGENSRTHFKVGTSGAAPSEVMTLFNGQLGIGKNTPQAKLDVTNSADDSTFAALYLQNRRSSTSAPSSVYLDFSNPFGADSDFTTARIESVRTASSNAPTDLAFHTFRSNNDDLKEKMRITGFGNVLIGGTNDPTSAEAALVIHNGVAPTASATNGVILFSEDVSSSAELKVRDEAGNTTTLSPHNFSLIPEGASEEMAWSYYSEKNGKKINVDMLKLARILEKLTGEKLVYIA